MRGRCSLESHCAAERWPPRSHNAWKKSGHFDDNEQCATRKACSRPGRRRGLATRAVVRVVQWGCCVSRLAKRHGPLRGVNGQVVVRTSSPQAPRGAQRGPIAPPDQHVALNTIKRLHRSVGSRPRGRCSSRCRGGDDSASKLAQLSHNVRLARTLCSVLPLDDRLALRNQALVGQQPGTCEVGDSSCIQRMVAPRNCCTGGLNA